MKNRLREEIAKLVLPYIQSCGCFSDCEVRASVLSHQILSLKIGSLSLEVVDNEAELPKYHGKRVSDTWIAVEREFYNLAKLDMLQANFRKVVTDA